MLYMFRTILVHHQEQLYKLYIAYTGISQYIAVVSVLVPDIKEQRRLNIRKLDVEGDIWVKKGVAA